MLVGDGLVEAVIEALERSEQEEGNHHREEREDAACGPPPQARPNDREILHAPVPWNGGAAAGRTFLSSRGEKQ